MPNCSAWSMAGTIRTDNNNKERDWKEEVTSKHVWKNIKLRVKKS